MRKYILLITALIISCSETITWNVELRDCSFEFRISDMPDINEETEIKYLFLKNVDNSSLVYNFICEENENVFSGEILSGKYVVACYFLTVKMVSNEARFYAHAYYVDETVFFTDSENKKNIKPVVIGECFNGAYYDGGNLRIDVDLSNDLFRLYKISAFSVKNGGKSKSYDCVLGSGYCFYDVALDKSKVIVSFSYSVKNYCDKNFLLEHEIKLTTTRFENLDISGLVK